MCSGWCFAKETIVAFHLAYWGTFLISYCSLIRYCIGACTRINRLVQPKSNWRLGLERERHPRVTGLNRSFLNIGVLARSHQSSKAFSLPVFKEDSLERSENWHSHRCGWRYVTHSCNSSCRHSDSQQWCSCSPACPSVWAVRLWCRLCANISWTVGLGCKESHNRGQLSDFEASATTLGCIARLQQFEWNSFCWCLEISLEISPVLHSDLEHTCLLRYVKVPCCPSLCMEHTFLPRSTARVAS